VIKGLLPNAISPATPEFRSKSSQNFLAYLSDRPQNLFNDFASKFRSFVNESAFGNRPIKFSDKFKAERIALGFLCLLHIRCHD